MKKFTVNIYNYYNNVIKSYQHNNYENAQKCCKKFCRWWSEIIDNETEHMLYVYDCREEKEYFYNQWLLDKPF